MSPELWLGIGHYLLSVLIIFSLLVALMEVSRKFDRYRDNSFLLLATGYFLLLVWALTWAMSLGGSILQVAGAIFQILGFLCLAIGYYLHQRAHPADEDDQVESSEVTGDQDPVQKSPESLRKAVTNDPKNSWMSLLSAAGEAPVSEEETAPAEESGTEEVPASAEATMPAEPPKKVVKKQPATGEVDLSYLSSRQRKSVADVKPVEAVVPAEIAPVKEPDLPKDLPKEEPQITESKVDTPPADDNNVTKKTTKPATKPEKKPSIMKEIEAAPAEPEKQSREEMLDDLFPLVEGKKKVKQESVVDDALPGEHEHHEAVIIDQPKVDPEPSVDETPTVKKTGRSKAPAALMITKLSGISVLQVWPEAIGLILVAGIMVALIPQRHQRGNSWLLVGFSIIFASQIGSMFLSPQLTNPNLTADSHGYLTLIIQTIEVLGFGCIGYGSWTKIKGKVTHHFIKIVSIIYLLLLVLTIGLALVIVHDQTSLQLLLLMMTGLLITILPVIHSLTYSHPNQLKPDEIVPL